VWVRSNSGLDFLVFYVIVKIRFGILSIVTQPQNSQAFPFCALFRGAVTGKGRISLRAP
jgi:hypothetical protein